MEKTQPAQLIVTTYITDLQPVQSYIFDSLKEIFQSFQIQDTDPEQSNTIHTNTSYQVRAENNVIMCHLLKIAFDVIFIMLSDETPKDHVYWISSIHVSNDSSLDQEYIQFQEKIALTEQEYQTSYLTERVKPQIVSLGQKSQVLNLKFKVLDQGDPQQSLFTRFENHLVRMLVEQIVFTLTTNIESLEDLVLPSTLQVMVTNMCQNQIKEWISRQDKRDMITEQVNNQLNMFIQENTSQFEDYNRSCCEVVRESIELIVRQMQGDNMITKGKVKVKSISFGEEVFKGIQLPALLQNQRLTIVKRLAKLIGYAVDQLYFTISQVMSYVIEEDIDCRKFYDVINDYLEQFMSKLSSEFPEYARVYDSSTFQLYMKIKELVLEVIKDLDLFLFKASCIANKHMEQLNDLLAKYHSLANVSTFQVLQGEVAQNIIVEVSKILQNEHFFYRPELFPLEDEFVKQTLRHFYGYSTETLSMFKMSTKTRNWLQAYQLSDKPFQFNYKFTILETNLNLSHQVINIKESNLLINHGVLMGPLQVPILGVMARYQVLKHQEIYNEKTGRVAIAIIITDSDNNQYPTLVLQIKNKQQSFTIQTARTISSQWIAKEDIIDQIISLEDFIHQKNEHVEYYSGSFNKQKKKATISSRTASSNGSLSQTSEELLKYKNHLNQQRKIMPQTALTNGNMAHAVSGGSIGAGLGCLIIDSLDPNIGWHEKLKRAGFTTVSTGLMGAAMRVSVIGSLINQAMLLYAVRKTLKNEVVGATEKLKQFGHIGVQSGVGVGSVVAGQILIPIPLLGAIIGGTVGGVAIGLYQKIIIPKAKSSMLKMIARLEERITVGGLLVYDDSVIKFMKINKKHFEANRPACFGQSEWLTIVSVYMANEVYYLFTLQQEEALAKVQEKLQEKPEDQGLLNTQMQILRELEQMDDLNQKWDQCRTYLSQQKIKSLKFANEIGQFVNGMITNFKV